MAFSPKINICLNSGCSTLTFRETTGVYDAETNTTGYGAPNITTGDVIQIVLNVTSPDGDIYVIDLTSEGFPTTNEDLEYEITSEDLDGITTIQDGLWSFTLTTITNSTFYVGYKSYFFYCNAECCVNKILATVEADECLCDEENNKRIDRYIKVKTFLESLKNAANCYNETRFENILAIINKLCRNADCKTCN